MTERVKTSFRIERRTIGRRKHDSGRADRHADRARPSDAHADRTGRLIAGAGNDRRALEQALFRLPPLDETRAQTSGDSNRRGSTTESSPAASTISCDHVRCATSSISVPDASATSVAYSPLSRRRTKSFGSSTRRTRRQASGSCARTHSSLVSVKLVSAGFDVSSSRRAAPIVSVSHRHSASVR